MSFIQTTYIKKHKVKTALYIAGFLVFIAVLLYFGDKVALVFDSAESVQAWVLSFGVYAPAALFVLQILQVLVAPLNNFVINFAGGYIFGPWVGFFLNYFGWITGAIIVFWFSRFFGRSFVGLFISEKKLAGFDHIIAKGKLVVFMLLILPGPPDDFLVYMMGLTPAISFRTFLWMVLIGKIPGKLATSFLASGVANHTASSSIFYILFVAVSIIIFWRRPELWQIWRTKKAAKKDGV